MNGRSGVEYCAPLTETRKPTVVPAAEALAGALQRSSSPSSALVLKIVAGTSRGPKRQRSAVPPKLKCSPKTCTAVPPAELPSAGVTCDVTGRARSNKLT